VARLWFITGAGRGLGRAFAEAALAHGDAVIATVRTDGVLDDLAARFPGRVHVRRLDVADRRAVSTVVADVVATVGVPDVIVNNAGYGLVGAVEEVTEAQLRAQFDVNLFGAVWVTREFLPHLRARGSGRIVQVSTVGAAGHLPLFGAYNATKWALKGLSAALSAEVARFGIRVHLLEPAGFATDWAGPSMRFADPVDAYGPVREAIFGSAGYPDGSAPEPAAQDGAEPDPWADAPPEVAAQALLALLDEPSPPLRSVIGNGGHDMVRMALEARRDDYRKDPAFVWPDATPSPSSPDTDADDPGSRDPGTGTGGPNTGAQRGPGSAALDQLRRWEDSGATWRVVSRTHDGVDLALLTCDAGEEVDRLRSADADLIAYLGDRTES
jgi:NAD(P)-dependent dehydrogenase (short-subunit alcohol dehydrogenase family)